MADKEVKASAENKRTKPSLFSRIGAWLKSLKSEWNKITWANWESVRKNTIIVIVCIVILAAALAIVDYLLSNGIQGLVTLVNNIF